MVRSRLWPLFLSLLGKNRYRLRAFDAHLAPSSIARSTKRSRVTYRCIRAFSPRRLSATPKRTATRFHSKAHAGLRTPTPPEPQLGSTMPCLNRSSKSTFTSCFQRRNENRSCGTKRYAQNSTRILRGRVASKIALQSRSAESRTTFICWLDLGGQQRIC